MFLQSVIVTLLLTLSLQAHGSDIISTNSEHVESAEMNLITEVDLNDMFDKALPLIRKTIVKGGLDPLSMPDQMLSVTNIPGLRGKIQLQHGWVQEGSSIRRNGDVIVRYSDKVIRFDAALGWDYLDVTYAYTFRYFLYTRKGEFNGRFNNVHIEVVGSIDLNTRKVELKFFKIVDIGQFSLKLHGHLTDMLLNAITKAVTVFCRDFVIREIEYRFEDAVQEKIKEINDLIPEPWYSSQFQLPWDKNASVTE